MSDVEWAFEDSKRYPYTVDYDVGKDLGEGKFSVVKYATHKKTGEECAIKCIDRVNTNPDELVHEAMLVQLVEEHPGIIKIKDVYEDRTHYYLVMEFVSGGELFDKIVESDSYSEREAALVIRQICDIVAFIHDKGVVHRDLKPENLLCKDKTGKDLKLCDFGLGDTIEEDELLTAIVGSTTYMAPEVDKGVGYDKSVDMYSIGVILYILLCGYPPFEPDSGITELEFPRKEWAQVSPVAISIIKRLLSPVPSERYTAHELLRQPWIRGESVSTRNLVGTIKNVKNFNTARRTGQTVRTKDPVTKATVFNVFDAQGNITPRGKSSDIAPPSAASTTTATTTSASTTAVPVAQANTTTSVTTTTAATASPSKSSDKKEKDKKRKAKDKDKKSTKDKTKERTASQEKKTVGFSEATTGNGKVVRVGFADAPLTDAEYKERYQQLATEFDSFKRAHEKEVKELRDQLAKYEKKASKSSSKSKAKK